MKGYPLNDELKKSLQKEHDDLLESLNNGTFSVDTKELSRLIEQLQGCKNKKLLDKLNEIGKKAGLLK